MVLPSPAGESVAANLITQPASRRSLKWNARGWLRLYPPRPHNYRRVCRRHYLPAELQNAGPKGDSIFPRRREQQLVVCQLSFTHNTSPHCLSGDAGLYCGFRFFTLIKYLP